MDRRSLLPLATLALTACGAARPSASEPATLPVPDRASDPACPVPGGVLVNELIRDGEVHFENLWRLTWDGENAEAYWNPAGDRLSFQRRWPGVECDRIFVTRPGAPAVQISDGRGTTTCAFFLPDGERVLFGSTGAVHDDCPPKPDMSLGYAWAIYPEFDIYVRDLASGETRPLVTGPGYDAEATVSPVGDRMVFTSTRSGDIELWTSDLEGGDLHQVTDRVGYDGGAFFSHDGTKLVYRTTAFDEADLEQEHARYRRLLEQNLIRPHSMEIWTVDADGSNPRQVTKLGKANWAPYFFPDDQRIVFCTNHHSSDGSQRMNFDLFAIDVDGGNLERITYEETFDSFPMFSPDGRYLAFASNRGAATEGDTNLYIAEWR